MQKIRLFLLNQLRQGITPQKLALTCAMGLGIGTFPVFGSTTLLCVLVALLLKLNQPTLQAINYLLSPLQLALIPIFIIWGERLLGFPPVALRPDLLFKEFFAAPLPFLHHYGAAAGCGIFAWAISAPIVMGVVYTVAKFLFIRWSRKGVHS